MKNQIRISFVTLLSILFFVSSKVSAVPNQLLTISPFLQEVTVASDESTKDFKVKITNNSNDVQNLKLSILDFGSLNDTGGVVFAGSNSDSLIEKYGLAPWLKLSEDKITLDPNQSKDINLTIVNDILLQPGGHYAAVVATVDKSSQDITSQISINQKLSSLIFAKKIGGEKYDLKLLKINSTKSKINLPEKIKLDFFNPGNVHVVPRGIIKIISPSGKIVSQGIINEDSSYVLPNTSRTILVQMNRVGSTGIWPALYKIQVDYRYDGIDQFARHSQFLYFLNIPGLLIVAILLIALAVFIRKYFKKLKTNYTFNILRFWDIKKKSKFNTIHMSTIKDNRIKNNKAADLKQNKLINLEKIIKSLKSILLQSSARTLENNAIPTAEKRHLQPNLKKTKKIKTQPVLMWSKVDRDKLTTRSKKVKKNYQNSKKTVIKSKNINNTKTKKPSK